MRSRDVADKTEWLTVEQIAQELGVHPETIREYIRDGLLKAVQLKRSYRIRRAEKEMHMIFPHIERAYRPGVDSTDAADFLFDKRCNLPGQDAFPIFGTPDKVISQFVGGMFGVLGIHTQHYNMCSSPY
jgi:excisionase family DNA binding protein